MIYLETFKLPIDKEEAIIRKRMDENGGPQYGYVDNIYPCRFFSMKDLREINFSAITIFYGGNGSGKSTLLNLIANKCELKRIAPFNTVELFDKYVSACRIKLGYDDDGDPLRVPNGSRIITSDDIFDYMLTVRTNNAEIAEQAERGKKEHYRLKYGDTVKLNGMEDYEALRIQLLARKKSVSRRQFIRQTAGKEVSLYSNGETAIQYFEQKLDFDTMYCLDEPENSMSPKMQMALKEYLEEMARIGGCQFIIATHSPFLLSMKDARIYDLDSDPVDIRNWWELENVRMYYDFFSSHSNLFK